MQLKSLTPRQRAQQAFDKLLKKVEAALTQEPVVWGFRVDSPDVGIHDGTTYQDDPRPEFVKQDDNKW